MEQEHKGVQIFNIDEAMKKGHRLGGRVNMANSPNCFVAVFKTPPREAPSGESRLHQHPDSDQIFVVVKGELTAKTPSGNYVLKQNQGVLIPAGEHYGFSNDGNEDLVFLSMRTESSGGRYSTYDKNAPSNVHVKIPAGEINANGLRPSYIFTYALDRLSFGIASTRDAEWDKHALLRMNCQYDIAGDFVLAKLPQRLVQWYRMEGLSDSDYELIPEPSKTKVRVSLEPLIGKQKA